VDCDTAAAALVKRARDEAFFILPADPTFVNEAGWDKKLYFEGGSVYFLRASGCQ